ncbi:DUF262 domain-containing protein [Microcoleus sp. herbarium7]|uniref:DUF262 domain-containing protein n=1 Tax=Microcoleus sp. herbarium7 TaxID=3055435 RepID=UPI002FD06167
MEWDNIVRFSIWGKRTYTVSWNDLEERLTSFEKTNNLNLDPDFHRGHVWSQNQQIKYVEYVLKRGHLSRDIIFNCPGWMEGIEGQMVLLDGKQRLEAARLFMSNELPVFGGVYRNELTRKGKPMPNFPHPIGFTFHINDLETRAEILQLYLDINAGGVVPSDDELTKVRALLEIEQSLSNSN